MRPDTSVSHSASRLPITVRLARAAAVAAIAVLAASCHSDKTTAVCTVTTLAFTTQPANTAAGSAISVTVTARDGSGNTATCFKNTVTIALGTNPGAATLGGTTTATAVSGVATFTNLSLTKAANGYTLTANGGGASGASSAFNITPGPASVLAFTTQPGNTVAGAAITTTVTARDQFGNTATGFTGNVAMTIGTNPGAGTLGGTTTAAAALGVASFTTLNINKVGTGYTLTAAAAGGAPPASATSTTFNITPGATAKLTFTTSPADDSAGSPLGTVAVTAQDANGNTTPAFTGAVTVAITANTGTAGAVLSGTKIVNALAGLASFTGLSIDKPGTGYTLTATAAGGVASGASTAFNIAVGSASQLVFTQQPTSATAGASIAPAITVTVQDAVGNTVTTFNSNVTLTIGTNPAGGTLSGTPTVAAASGVATFPGLSIDKAGAGYILTATAGAVSKQSSTFAISPAPPTQLVFTTQPVQTAAGATIPTVVVTAEDQFNNVATSFVNQVTVAITGGTGKAGATLSGTKVVTAAAGAATFATLSIDSVGTNYTLTATATGLVGGFASASFNIVPNVATVLVFTAQPSNKTAGLAIAPAVVVTARDAKGNTATGFVGNVAMAITAGTGTPGAALNGTTSVGAVAGVATFSNLRVNKSGAGYTITASSAGLTSDTSATFAITPGAATKVAFTAQPSLTTAGQSIAPAVQVTAQDSLGNADTAFAGSITVTITAATGTAGAHLGNGGPVAVTAHTGIATFSTLNIDSAGANYTLSATGTGAITGVPSTPFNIKPGAATQLAFTAQPVTTTAGQPITPAIKVTARDALGNTDTTFKTAITLAITPATGTSGAHLLNGVATAAAGVATFSTVSIDSTGANYTLTATGAAVSAATSGTFNIKPGTAVKLGFLVEPTSATAGPPATIPTVKVTAQDVLGNTDTLFTGNITVAIGANPGGGSLAGTLIVAAVKGVATYSDLAINKSGTNYKLQATSGALSPAASAFFDIIAGTATKLAFTVDPVITQAAPATITPAVEVSGEDDLGNTDLTYTGSVSIAIGTNPSSGVLTGTTPVTAVNGVARFTDLTIDKVGNGYTLNATASLVTGTTSAAFDIIPNTVATVEFSTGPSATTAGVAMSPVVVTAFDASHNLATQFTGGVTLSITPATGTAGAHLTHGNSVTVNAVAGVATFSNLRVDSAGTGYTLDASGPATATSGSFDITPAPAAVLVFTAQPHNAVAGVSNAPAIVVTARDSVGNTATSFNGTTVNLSINTGPTGGTILSGGSATASLGVATFNALKNDIVGSYTLAASGGAVSTPVASSAYSITPAAASSFAFTGQPSNTVAAVAINPAIQVTARDPFGNTDTNYGSSVTLSISTNPGGGTIGGATQAASAGIVSFPNVTIDKVANGYRLSASDGSISSAAPSNLFNITPALATKLVFTTNPVTTTAGQTMTTVAVAAEDPNGNIDTSYTGTITLAFANNPGGGGLGGTLIKVSPHGVGGGVVTFTDLSINVAQMGYKLQVTSGALAQGQSSPFNIVAAPATQLAFIVQPDVIVKAGGTFHSPTGVRVAAEDQFGNIDSSFTGTVDMTLAGPTSTLLGTVHVAAVTGVASFPDLRIHPAGIDYTLSANFTGLVGNTSAQFDVRAAPADHLVFTGQPSDKIAGQLISPFVVVAARDTFDNLDSGFTANVTLSVNSGPAAVLQNAQVTPANGLATFTNFNVETAGGPRTLVANGGGITTPVASGAFTITAAAANHLDFTQQPTNAVAGVAITPAIVVTAKDQFNNTDPAFDGVANDVTLSVNTGVLGVLVNTTATPTAGVATFTTFNIETVANFYTLKAAGGSIVSSPLGSDEFNISPAAPDHFAFVVDPTDAVAGVAISPAIVVEARDPFDNLATGFTGKDIALSISSGPGVILSGATATATGGVATFSAVSIDLAGAHTLDAINAVLGDCPTCTAGTSASFNITHAAATKLGFVQEPGTTVHNVAISPAVAVAAQDPFGNTDPTFTGTVTISIGVNPASGVLSGTLTQAFGIGTGIATFNNLSIDNIGSGYRLLAVSSPVLTQILSASFNIN